MARIQGGQVDANRECIKAVLWGSALTMGLFVLTGCGTSHGSFHPGSAPGREDSKQACSDATSCRDTLRALRDVTPLSPCELRTRAEIASRACDLGVAEGCTTLGRMEPGHARDLFQRACELGDGEGCARKGLFTLLGEGALQDASTGLAELQAACDAYPRAACGIAALGLGEDARRRGSEPEWEWIALFAQRGCDAGDGLACRLLGDAFQAGQGVSQDMGKAFELYARACEAGNGMACADQGMISLRYGAEEAGELPRADDLFSRGCALGSSEACRLLVVESLSMQEGMRDDASRQALFRQACDRGAAMGCLALYDSLRNQPRAPGAPLELPGLLKRACRFGETQACEFLEDISRVSQRQCGAGSAKACGVLGALMLSQPTFGSEVVDGMRILQRACLEGDASSCSLVRELAPRSDELTCRSE
ncbi:sel1 repeat family protein [Archangium violaceum]|uniref:tetratricopeptide repeat protein n=1 Tax=Archangium violaceum TaxID=83451 RepID=UPI00193BF4EB|nr:tetratricopeptide repeat protein [Archangium violaceum]QRK04822.1 sel1 repeat family protein [Archangium violaceum]